MSQKVSCPECGGPVGPKGHSRGKKRWKCRDKACAWHGTNAVGAEAAAAEGICNKTSEKLHKKIRLADGVQRYVVTAAQNATPINEPFFQSLLTYCKVNDAQLVVIPYRYKNPTSMWTANNKKDDWWAPELKPYIMAVRTPVGPHTVILADIMTQPTASSPLDGFETLVGAHSAIIGHPKLELKTIPTPQAKLPKILTTTGACTVKNYVPGKAGKKAEHHHTFGACVLELDGDVFHMRQLNAVDDGSFMDLDREYRGESWSVIEHAAALVLGDLHEEFLCPEVAAATFGEGGIVDVLRPKKIVYHDVHDFYSANHHHKHEVFIKYAKFHSGASNVKKALEKTFATIDSFTRPGIENIFVPSNHPDALARWVKETDPRLDPENCVFWSQTFEAMCLGSRMTNSGAQTIDPFAHWGMKMLKHGAQARFLARDESMTVERIEIGYHGDKGPNGARGSRKGFSRIGVKTVIGHSHSPGICEGTYQTGTSSQLRLEYNSGPSSWLNTHCVIYPNGKRSLINIINGLWKAGKSTS